MIELERAVKLWNAGLTMTQIGKELSLTKGQVARRIADNRDLFSRRVDPIKPAAKVQVPAAVEFTAPEIKKAVKYTSPRLYVGIGNVKTKNATPQYIAHQKDKISMAYRDATGGLPPKSELADVLKIFGDLEKNRKSANALRKNFIEASAPTPRCKANDAAYDQERLQYAVTMADLDTRKCCTWPVTDNPKGVPNRFCAEVKAGKNYCRAHEERQWRVA